MTVIRKITASETYPLRQQVLRPGKPITACYFDGDHAETTRHYGLLVNDNLLAIISLFDNVNPLFNEQHQVQIRGMAVSENTQGNGYGRQLVDYCEAMLRETECNLIWFNAREKAVGFYQKLGYTLEEPAFEIVGVGTHYVMWKKL